MGHHRPWVEPGLYDNRSEYGLRDNAKREEHSEDFKLATVRPAKEAEHCRGNCRHGDNP